MVSKLAVLATVLMAVDVVTALYARATYPRLDRDMSAAFSDAEGLSKREKTCKAGKTLCNDEVAFCAHVCCYENGKFAGGCPEYTYCDGEGANAGCCPIGEICSGTPPPCADAGQFNVPSPTLVCETSVPICTSLANGAPVCSGSHSDWLKISATLKGGADTTSTPTPSSNKDDDDSSKTTPAGPTPTAADTLEETTPPTSDATSLVPGFGLLGVVLAAFML